MSVQDLTFALGADLVDRAVAWRWIAEESY